eukprot:TRINITY_DN90496_c0_g1_i1.p1 TRINITY_DN90496_c0_g1~~TRINITY_DN90496_c0_g1_i1.p1  ORF type:complete len:185 (-),score=13.49 TRINITY_DN90496_c0_g1_i1:25-528(-)
MPSSHSALATGWFVLSFLDAVFRVVTAVPNRPGEEQHDMQRSIFSEEHQKTLDFCKILCFVPWVQKDELTHTEFAGFVAFWAAMMLPVPFMRVVIHDHSNNQVAVGTLIGAILAIVWWRVVRILQRSNQALEKQKVLFGLVTHDYYYNAQPVSRSAADAGRSEEPHV